MPIMNERTEPSYPPGHQPYDPLNGLRIGALAGGVLAVIPIALLGFGFAWLMVVGAAIGGAAGYLRERRGMRRRPDEPG